jgi:hypothetical protein
MRAAALAAGAVAFESGSECISVGRERFEERAQEYQIHDMEAHYSSAICGAPVQPRPGRGAHRHGAVARCANGDVVDVRAERIVMVQ